MSVVIETTLGDIVVDLYLRERPKASLNFLKLCKLKYYNFNLFHTISRGFIAQTGDPTGIGTGGESIFGVIDGPSKRYFEAENEPRIKHTRAGLISFVGGEDKIIGSQFFLTLGEDLTYLDDKHCVFGEVTEGIDVLEAINEVICDKDDRPYQDVRITHTVVLEDPYPDPKGFQAPSRSPSPSAERLAGGRIAPDEEIDETSGKTNQEIAEMQAEREAKARATILEMVGDIPDADMAPPENVLFVCKLNPVTTDDDLEIIFSRFGKIKSCEVIRDRKTGDSLQYAFIEFEEQKPCEDAYFKMSNVLIDDRRIHVDFSQSVSKVKWLGKGRGVTHFDEKGNKKNADTNNDIGKGNYKVKNGYQDEHRESRKVRNQSQSPRRKRSRTPKRDRRHNEDGRKQRSSRSPKRKKTSPQRYRRGSPSVSHSYSAHRRRKSSSPSPVKNKKENRSPIHQRRSHSPPPRYTKSSSYRRSKSPRNSATRRKHVRGSPERNGRGSSESKRSISPKLNKRGKSRERSKSAKRERVEKDSKMLKTPYNSVTSRDTNKENTRAKATSEVKKGKSYIRKDRNIPLEPEIKDQSEVRQKSDKKSKSKTHSTKEKRKKTRSETSDESNVESEEEKPKKKKKVKKVRSSSESSSSEDDSSSSEEEKSRRKKKRKTKKKIEIKKRKKSKKKYSSSESLSSESDSSSSNSSSTTTTTSSSSSSTSSESDQKSKRKRSKKTKKKRTKNSRQTD